MSFCKFLSFMTTLRTILSCQKYYSLCKYQSWIYSKAQALKKEQTSFSNPLHIVLGNESCDLDSAVSAILYAYYLSVDGRTCVLPILNIPASHLPIKTEVVQFLQDNSISLDTLVFRDSLNLYQLSQSSNLKVTLVDHHVLAARDKVLKPHVIEILDHRPVSPTETWTQLERGTTMDIVGSCVTHVARKMLTNQADLIKKSKHVANLIYGTILLDTANLSPLAKRATPADLDVIARLKSFHPDLQAENDLFEYLLKAKSNVSHLTSAQLLVKDLKFTKHGVPIAGLPILVKDFLGKTLNLRTTLDRFLHETNSSILILMGQTIRAGQIERDLGLYSISPEGNEKIDTILAVLRTNENPSLNMEQVTHDQESLVKVFRCNNVQVSRKQVLPLVERALEL